MSMTQEIYNAGRVPAKRGITGEICNGAKPQNKRWLMSIAASVAYRDSPTVIRRFTHAWQLRGLTHKREERMFA